MIQPATLTQLIAADPIAPAQRAIVETVKTKLPGVSVMLHPGKVDISELVSKALVAAPGVGIGWSRVRTLRAVDGHFSFLVDWVAYIVAEARAVDNRRVEKEAVALAIGNRLMLILADGDISFWGLSGISPPEPVPGPEFKPLFTVADASQGTVYYTVTWSQTLTGLGATYLPTVTGTVDPDAAIIHYPSAEELAEMDGWLAGGPEVDDA